MSEQEVMAFLNEFKGTGVYAVGKSNSHYIDVSKYCLGKGLVKEYVGGALGLDDKGHDLLDGIITWDELFPKPILPISFNNSGIFVAGDSQRSDLRQNNSRDKQIINPKIDSDISKKPAIEKWMLIISVATLLIGLLVGLKTCGYIN